jgi:hypothetical protein
VKLELPRTFASSVVLALSLSSWLPNTIQAQGKAEKWQRVFTAEEFSVDVNPASLTFEPGHILRARFRTIYSKGETTGANPVTKYKTRLESIAFKANEKRYRVDEISLVDSDGKTVQSWSNSSEAWKDLKDGGIMQRQLAAAQSLNPLGLWKVVAYRYGEGSPAKATEPPELANLVGTRVRLNIDAAEVGTKRCQSPAYRSRHLTDKEFFQDMGTSLSSLGIKTDRVETVAVKCETGDWKPPQSLLVRLPEGEALLLWNDVFLELKRQRGERSNKVIVLKNRQ